MQGRCRIRFVSELLNEQGAWNQALLHDYFLPADVTEIMKIRTSPRLEEDTLAWGPSKYGVFSVKSAYQFGFDEAHRSATTGSSSRPDGARSCWQLIWSTEVPPTVRNFAWRVAIDSLPTWRNKHVRGLETTDLCPLCATETEDCFHSLCRCTFSRILWETMADVWTLPCITSMHNSDTEWLLHVLETLPEIERSMLLMMLWRAWYIRNEVIHHKPVPPMEASKRFLVSYLDSLIGIRTVLSSDPSKGKSVITYDIHPRRSHVITNVAHPKWIAPKAGWVQLCTDGSYADDGSAGAGMVLRDDKGSIIFSSCRQLFSCCEALEAELCACMEGLSFAIQRSVLRIMIEMDSIVAVKLIQAQEVDRSVYAPLTKEIRYLMCLRDSCITHINRSQNKVSDSLAKFARLEGRTMTWIGSGPSQALEFAVIDCMDLVI
uniref:RNase H type-1 domain-containing protein n=2 Tax=Aegilops tauschii subsp. strangulata TaxID=200361 RepID=A0A453SWV1_AEGTS